MLISNTISITYLMAVRTGGGGRGGNRPPNSLPSKMNEFKNNNI